ncbi:MAG TPA: hypothetical protein VKX17_28555 [Planctomycetota bacterium]|nr:hypothetical protein [Planctomycetota bacterium]
MPLPDSNDEPRAPVLQGRWQVTLRELLICSWVTGLLMLMANEFCSRKTMLVGVLLALLMGLCFTALVLKNARMGHELSRMRLLGALGVLFIVIGLFSPVIVEMRPPEPDPHLLDGDGLPRRSLASLRTLGLYLLGALSLVTGCVLTWFTKSFLHVPKQMENAPEETMQRLLEAKKRNSE